MNKGLITVFFSILIMQCIHAQDLHFSHFYNAPLILNPVSTGHFDGTYRFGGNYKSQWNSFVRGYTTYQAFFDYRLVRRSSSPHQVGLGIYFSGDEAGTGELSTRRIFGSMAYHFSAGRRKNLQLSIGAGLGYVQKRIDFSHLIFDKQWTSDGFNSGLPSGEPLAGKQELDYMDIKTGAMISWQISSKFQISLSGGYQHIITPAESFYNAFNELDMRPVYQADAFLRLSGRVHLEPAFVYSELSGASEFLAGANLGYQLSGIAPPGVFAGLWVRNTRDLIPVIGMDYNRFRIFISYDTNISGLKPASELRGGLELSVVYIGLIKSKFEKVVIPCVRF